MLYCAGHSNIEYGNVFAMIWFRCKYEGVPHPIAIPQGRNKKRAAIRPYLAKLVYLSNRIIPFYQSEPSGVINNRYLFEIFWI
jgi:hypothetical protein